MALKVGELYASFGIDSSELDGALSDIEKKCNDLASSMTKTGAVLSAAVTAPLVKIGKSMYEAGTSFYSQMDRVEAISGATADEMADLTDKAIYMGSTTSFTATEAGEALEYMAMAGWKSDQMLEGLAPIMNLAAASGEDLAGVSDIVTDALTAFGLGAEDAADFADVLAATATNANTNVGLMGETFKYVAPLAGAMGYSIEDTAAAIGIMANSGIKGSQAGTALRNIISNLAKPTDAVAAAMDELGISITDSSGAALPLSDVIGQLRTSFDGMTESEKTMYAATIAGKYGMSGLLALVNASDEEFAKLTAAIDGSAGATQEMADIILDNAAGDVTIFKSAIEGLEITLWGLVEGPFRSVVKTATKWADSFREMDSATQMAVLKVGALAAAAGPALLVGGRLVKVVGKLIPLMKALASPVGIVAGAFALFAIAAVDENNDIGKAFTKMSKKVKTSLTNVNKTITSTMKTVSGRMPALCKSVVEGIQDILPAFIDTAMLAVTGFMDVISDNASNIAEIGKTIITSIVDGIAKNVPQLIPAAAKVVASIATALIDNMPSIVSSVGNLMSAVATGIQNTDWLGLGKQILDSISNAITGITDIFSNWFSEASAFTSSLDWASIGTQIIDMILGATVNTATTIGNFLANLVESIGNYTGWSSLGTQLGKVAEHLITGIADAIPALTDVVVKIIDAISSALSGQGADSMLTGFQSLAMSIVDGVAQAIPKVSESASKIVTALANLLNGIDWTKAAEVASTLGSAIIDVLVKGIEGASDVAVTIVDAIASMFNEDGLATKLMASAGNIATTLITAIADAIPKVVGAATNIIGKIGELLASDDTEAFANSVSGIAKTLIDNIVDAIPKVANGAADLIKAIGNLLTGEGAANLVEGFGTIATSIINGVVDAIPTVANAAANIIGAIGEVLGGEQTDAVISSLVGVATSIINGIVDAIPKVAGAAVNIIDAIGTLLSGESLQNMMESLKTIASSIIDGIVQAIPAVAGAAVDIIGAISDLLSGESADNLLSGMTGIAKTIIEGIAKAIPGLVSMAGDIVQAVGDLLASINWATAIDSVTTLGEAIIDALVAGIEGLGDLGVDIVEAVGGLLKSIDWDSIAVSLDGFADMLVQGIVKGIEAISGADVKIIGAIGDLLGNADWAKLGASAESIATTLIDGIVTGLKSLTTGATNIINAITEMFGKINWKDLADTAASIAGTLIDGIVTGLADLTPDMSELLSSIGRGIAAAGEGLGTVAGELVNKLVTAIITPENWVKLIELGGKIVEGLATGILNLGAGILEGAWSFVSETMKGLFRALGFEIPEWSAETEAALQEAGEVINSEAESISVKMEDMIAFLGTLDWAGGMNTENLQSAVQMWSFIVENGTDELISSLDEYAWLGSEQIVNLFTILCDTTASEAERAAAMIALNDLGFGDFVMGSFANCDTAIIAAAREMSENGVATFEDAFSVLGLTIPESVQAGLDAGLPYVEAAAAAIADTASTTNEQATAEAAAAATGEAITSELASAEEGGEGEVEGASEGVVDVATLALETLPDVAEITGQDTSNGMASGIDAGAPTVVTSMDTLSASVVEAAVAQMSYDTGYTIGYDHTDGMRAGIDAVAGSLKTAAETAAKNACKAADTELSKNKGENIGKQFANAIKSAIQSAASSISSAAKSAAQGAVSAASSTLSYSAGSSIGSNFDSGIAAGIRSGSSAITSAARSAAQAALSAAKSTLGIHSPSKVAKKEVGFNYDAGIAEGVLDNASMIEKAAASVSSMLHDSFLIGDPSRGTVYTSQNAIQQAARQNAEANGERQSLIERAETIGRAIADRLIDSGALDGDVIMDGDKVGEKVSNPVSKSIHKKSKQTIKGRCALGVI